MTIEIRNAIITEAIIEIDSYNRLTSWLILDYGAECQNFGGFSFDEKDGDGIIVKAFGSLFIRQSLEISDVKNWNDIKGKAIRVRFLKESESILEIGHITKEIWFNANQEYKLLESCNFYKSKSESDTMVRLEVNNIHKSY